MEGNTGGNETNEHKRAQKSKHHEKQARNLNLKTEK